MKGTGNPFPSCPDYLLYAKINPIPNRGPTIWCKWAAILSPRPIGGQVPAYSWEKNQAEKSGGILRESGGETRDSPSKVAETEPDGKTRRLAGQGGNTNHRERDR